MADIEYVESHANYRCTCPLPQTEDEEIELARACWERERAAQAPARPAGGDESAAKV